MSRIADIRAAASGGLPASVPATALNTTNQPTDAKGAEIASATSNLKEPDMADKDLEAAVAAAKKEGHVEGFKAANARITSVFASAEATGREASAVKMLSKESMASASADDIIDLLADMPKADASAMSDKDKKEAAEEGGRKEMQEQLAKTGNSDVQPGSGGKTPEASAESIWDKAQALVG